MWKMRLMKTIELYAYTEEKPWRISLLELAQGDLWVELSCPFPDVEKVRLKTLGRLDYEKVVALMIEAVQPVKIKRSIESGWKNEESNQHNAENQEGRGVLDGQMAE